MDKAAIVLATRLIAAGSRAVAQAPMTLIALPTCLSSTSTMPNNAGLWKILWWANRHPALTTVPIL